MSSPSPSRTRLLTGLALVCFAANSVIGRKGLLGGDIGAASFAAARLLSGALMLVLILGLKRVLRGGDWPSAAALVLYAFCFSFAYLAVDAGAGALILFAVVQVTMVGAGCLRGSWPSLRQWAGMLLALGALAWWLWPGGDAPSLPGAAAMAVAGFGWGVYSLLGLGGGDPVERTAGNFVRAAIMAAGLLPFLLLAQPEPLPGWSGLGYAALTGAVTSGLGYVLWYAALAGLDSAQAAVAQLSVPVLAALGGILMLGEPATLRFAIAASLILAGVGLAIWKPAREA